MNKIDQYISQFPHDVQVKLNKIRSIIKTSAPGATETIKYQMPTYVLKENLVHFAGYKSHIGFYPTPSAVLKFKDELKQFKTSKGAIQFPLDEEIPYDLVERIVRFRVDEAGKV